MPHKRAKRSVREKEKAERKLDLPPSESTSTSNDIPKSMARVLNAEAIQNAWRERKRTSEGDQNEVGQRKKRKTESGPVKTEIKIKPGESLGHFKRRVEDDMRPLIRSAMKNTTSVSKQKLKESQKDIEQLANPRAKHKYTIDANTDSNTSAHHIRTRGGRSLSPDFVRVSSSDPKRLNDVVKAPPELKVAPRLNRLVQKAQKQKRETKSTYADGDQDEGDGVITLQQKRMMELEREKAINRYRALKEVKLKERQKEGNVLVKLSH